LLEEQCIEAFRRGRAEGVERWDAWFGNACCFVDAIAEWPDEWLGGIPAPGLPGAPLPTPLAKALEDAVGAPEKPASFLPCILSTSSTSALARALAGPVKVEAKLSRSPFASVR